MRNNKQINPCNFVGGTKYKNKYKNEIRVGILCLGRRN